MVQIKLEKVTDIRGRDLSKAVGKQTTPLSGDSVYRYMCGHCEEELLSRLNPLGKKFLFECPQCQQYSENESS